MRENGSNEDYVQSGDRMRNSALSLTLELVANDSQALYNGLLARYIVADVNEQGNFGRLELLQKSDFTIIINNNESKNLMT